MNETEDAAMLIRLLTTIIAMGSLWAGQGAAAERPVVVELFTSEGCSSCPPADAFLTELVHNRRDVLPLAFHVTYWNGLGWKDPYSLAEATARQAAYGGRFGDGSYTPEMVVDGAANAVGSDRGAVEAVIGRARSRADRGPEVSLRRDADGVAIAVGPGHGSARIVLVGFDPEHRTSVGRGENSGRTLIESNIVRSIRTIGQWSGEPVTTREHLPVGQDSAVLLEAPDGHIIGASRDGG